MTPADLHKLIQEWAVKLHRHNSSFGDKSDEDQCIENATQSITQLFLEFTQSVKPEKITDADALWSAQKGHPLTYNQAIEEYARNLRGGLNG